MCSRGAVEQAAGGDAASPGRPTAASTALTCSPDTRVDEHRPVAVGEQLGDDAGALLGRLARAEDCLRHALAEGAVVVDEGAADVGEGQPAQPGDRLVGA